MSDETSPDRIKSLEVRYEYTPTLPGILSQLRASLIVSTYQTGRVVLLGVHEGQLQVTFIRYDQPMGVAVEAQRLAVGSRRQMQFLAANRDVASSIRPPGTFDLCYVPKSTAWTGRIHGHDLAWGTEGLWIVNTLFSCLCTLHEDFNFVPRWQPRFISSLADQDRCHLNGLALRDGRPAFVTALAETDVAGGWRAEKASGGVVIDVISGETIARGFSMPHSPRWHNGRLWVLDSGRGTLNVIDPDNGRTEVVESFPGYCRGLSFHGSYAFVGLSKIRETSVFGGVPIAEYCDQLKCGIGVVDLAAGKTVSVFQFITGVTELFAVEVNPHALCPYIAGAETEGEDHDVWIVPQPGLIPAISSRRPWFA